MERLDGWAQRLALTFGADWFRLDVFAGDVRRGWLVNEVTYPSHLAVPEAVWARYAARYASNRTWRSVAADEVLGRVGEIASLSEAFLRTRSSLVVTR